MTNAGRGRFAYGWRHAVVGWFFLCAAVALAANGTEPLAPRVTFDLDGRLRAFALSPDARFIAAGGETNDGARALVTVWDRLTGVVLRRSEEGDATVLSLAFSPDGERVAAGLEDGSVRVLALRGGEDRAWQASTGPVLACAFDPSGDRVATSGSDQVVRLWDWRSGEQRGEMRGHAGAVFALAFRPDGDALLSGGADGAIILWDTVTGEPRARWQRHTDTVSDLAFRPDGRSFVSAGWDGRILLTTPDRNVTEPLASVQGLVFSIAVSPDGREVAAGSSEREGNPTLQIWDIASGAAVMSLGGPTNSGVGFFADGSGLVAATARGEVRVWELDPTTPIRRTQDDSATRRVEWEPSEALYYEVQFTARGLDDAGLGFRADDPILVTRDTSAAVPSGFLDGQRIWWRVRARGFGAASDWSTPGSILPAGPIVRKPTIRVAINPTQMAPGDEGSIQLFVENAEDLAGFEAELVIEPPLVDVLDVREGRALRADGVATFWKLPTVFRDESSIRIVGLAQARLGAGGIDADGSLVSMTIRARRGGVVNIRVQSLKLSDSRQQPIEADVRPASATILTAVIPADTNRDGTVDVFDLVFVAQFFGQAADDPAKTRADVNTDGAIDVLDLLLIARDYARSLRAPRGERAAPVRLEATQAARLDDAAAWIREHPTAIEDAELRALVLSLLDSTTADGAPHPSRVRIFAGRNFPNPSNPETWIPFRLTAPAEVSATIFDLTGRVVRRLALGPRDAGRHDRPGTAVHWDGRTANGSQAASGVYIVRLRATPLAGGPTSTATVRVALVR